MEISKTLSAIQHLLKSAFTLALLGVCLGIQPAGAVGYRISWLDVSNVALNSSVPNGQTFTLPGYGLVRVSYTSTTLNWYHISTATAQNGSITYLGDTYAWTVADGMAATNFAGSGALDYNLTFTFLGPPVPAGQLVLASFGLGAQGSNKTKAQSPKKVPF